MNVATATCNDVQRSVTYELESTQPAVHGGGLMWSNYSRTSESVVPNLRSCGDLRSLTELTEAYAQFSQHWRSSYSPMFSMMLASAIGGFGIGVGQTPTVVPKPFLRSLINAEQEQKVSEWVVMNSVPCSLSLPRDVLDFLNDRNIVTDFSRFVNLAASTFYVQRYSASLQVHPEEEGNEWVELEVALEGETARVLTQYDEFLRSTSAKIPPVALQWFRLSLDIL